MRKQILEACFSVLKPLAKVLLLHGFSFTEFENLCRRAFVQTAAVEFGIRGRHTNSSRIAAMTGIPRKEVQRIRKGEPQPVGGVSTRLSPLADLLHVWATSSAYCKNDLSPRDLPVGDMKNGSFDALVRECFGDVPPGAVRAELVRLGVAEHLPNGKLRMLRRSLIPSDVDERLASSMAYSLRGLAETIAYNNDPRRRGNEFRFERFVESRLLTDDEISHFRRIVHLKLEELSLEIDDLLGGTSDAPQPDHARRVGVGFFYTE